MKPVLGAVVVCAAAVVMSVAWSPGVQAQAPPAPPAVRPALDHAPSVLGVSVRDAGDDDIRKSGLSQPGGVVIDRVTQGSAADHAGLKQGDLVVEFDGERVRSARQFTRLVQDTPAGRTVKAVVVRDGARQTLDVTPEAPRRAFVDIPPFPADMQEKLDRLRVELPDFPGFTDRERLGTSLTPLSGQLADYFGVSRGVLVSSVDTNSPAARAGLKAGDVITAINGHEVDTPADVRHELRDAGTGAALELSVTRDHKKLTLSARN